MFSIIFIILRGLNFCTLRRKEEEKTLWVYRNDNSQKLHVEFGYSKSLSKPQFVLSNFCLTNWVN